jgi:hypothetical protein
LAQLRNWTELPENDWCGPMLRGNSGYLLTSPFLLDLKILVAEKGGKKNEANPRYAREVVFKMEGLNRKYNDSDRGHRKMADCGIRNLPRGFFINYFRRKEASPCNNPYSRFHS